MKNVALILTIPLLFIGCVNNTVAPSEIVMDYYRGFHDSDFKRIKLVIDDTITITQGDYMTAYAQEEFYEFFKWDSVFNTTYEIVEITKHKEVTASVKSHSVRYEFLKNNPLICEFRFEFKNHKIAKIASLDCPNADWLLWQQQRDSLVKWVHHKHPNLDGFIHDMTMDGAIDYVKAMELYRKEQL